MLTPLPEFLRMQPGLVSPVFVGRGAELAALVAALESAVHGEPAVVLVGGEAGVGKTRLVEEAAERARASGTRVLTGSDPTRLRAVSGDQLRGAAHRARPLE